ncbi:ribonuclease H-like domain-containing protein [[Eubacterium] cellulosolvens]
MLRYTFLHLPHIGPITEQKLWANDILTWEDLLNKKNEFTENFQHLKSYMMLSQHQLRKKDAQFFLNRLGTEHHWRIFPEFRSAAAYLDIETTGLGGPRDYITTISMYDGNDIYYYIHDENMDDFLTDIQKYKVLITYNGKCFDVPFIENEFGISIHHAQLDLRYILRSVGLTGGLKSCEHQLGLTRGDLEGVDGYFAVLLWRDYMAGNRKALETLMAYNIADTVNLEKLMVIAYNKKLAALPLPKNILLDLEQAEPRQKTRAPIPFKPDSKTIQKIKSKFN